jgi:hypothetical protein
MTGKVAHRAREQNMRVRRTLSSLFGFVLVCTAALPGAAQIAVLPHVGDFPTAYPLGRGGFAVRAGYEPFRTRLPPLNRPPITQSLDIGGVPMDRRVTYVGDAGLAPLVLSFGVGEATDFSVAATLASGTSEKRITNFYGVPEDVYRDSALQYDRVYGQPVFDVGLGIRHQFKPDLGDGLPALAAGVVGRFGFTGDDVPTGAGEFRDSSPADGFPDFGGAPYLAGSLRVGEYAYAHGHLGLLVSRKLGAGLVYGAAGEVTLVPDRMSASASFVTRRETAGLEHSKVKENFALGIRYHLSSGAAVQLTATPEGSVLFTLTRLGEKAEQIAPQPPRPQERLF